MDLAVDVKQQIKEALIEFFRDDNVILRKVISDIMEDIVLGNLIEEGDTEDYVDEETILAHLNNNN
jgi:hypothetical protein